MERQAINRLLAAFEAGQIGADKSVAKEVAHRSQNVSSGGPGKITAERDESAELIARLVLEDSGGSANQRLPEELQRVVLFDVLSEAEDLQVAEKRFGVAGELAFPCFGFDDEVEPTPLKVEFAIGQSKVIDFCGVQAEKPSRPPGRVTRASSRAAAS